MRRISTIKMVALSSCALSFLPQVHAMGLAHHITLCRYKAPSFAAQKSGADGGSPPAATSDVKRPLCPSGHQAGPTLGARRPRIARQGRRAGCPPARTPAGKVAGLGVPPSLWQIKVIYVSGVTLYPSRKLNNYIRKRQASMLSNSGLFETTRDRSLSQAVLYFDADYPTRKALLATARLATRHNRVIWRGPLITLSSSHPSGGGMLEAEGLIRTVGESLVSAKKQEQAAAEK